MSDIIRIKSITEMFRLFGMEDLKHPLISVVEEKELKEQSKIDPSEYMELKLPLICIQLFLRISCVVVLAMVVLLTIFRKAQ